MSGAGASRDYLEPLAACDDAASLRSAVNALCARFGKPRRIDVVTVAKAERRQALCFLKLESAKEESAMMAALGITRFGDELLIVVDLREAPATG